ncbi:DUF2382 domain-containing protein [Teichococcus aestuarii]|uniref:DUF2382 domain-containing protein n=1 Tax=Teichococcus aestuarii TaxID=568898 RepID=UPI0036179BA5
MTCTITGLFDTREAAQHVVDHLTSHDGVDRNLVRIHGREEQAATGTMQGEEDQGVWASLKNLFMPDEDRYAYSEGIRRGGIVVSVEVVDEQVDHAMDVFESNGAVDLDSREVEWRGSGWSGYNAGTSASTPSMTSVPGGVGIASGAGMGGGAVAAGGDAVAAGGIAGLTGSDQAGSDRVGSGGTGSDRIGSGGTGSDLPQTRRDAAVLGGERDVIPVVEEQLRVGKRETERGRVRVRSYVVETQATEQVSLRDEHVNVERHAVDRPLTDADDAFRERTIEAVEHGEEAVVSKEARVVEEISLSKDASQRQETVHENLRRQEVEVEDDRSGTTSPMPRNPA